MRVPRTGPQGPGGEAALDAVKDDDYFPALFVAATTGMRRSEVPGLRRKDVDLACGRASILQRVVLVDAQAVVLSGTKRESSRRKISLNPATVAARSAWRVQQLEERLAAGTAWREAGLVFTTPAGQVVNPERLSRAPSGRSRMSPAFPTSGSTTLGCTYATLALQAGLTAKVVSERLGRKTTSITEDLYLNVTHRWRRTPQPGSPT
jgi:integrase